MQLDQPLLAGLLMQSINILGHHAFNPTSRLEIRQSRVRAVGTGSRKGRPAAQTAGPVAFSGRFTVDEVLMLDRCRALPVTAIITVGFDSGRCAAASTGDHKQSLSARHKSLQLIERQNYLKRSTAFNAALAMRGMKLVPIGVPLPLLRVAATAISR